MTHFETWVRIVATPGHARITVAMEGDEPAPAAAPAPLGSVQCYTTERIPFVMKRSALLAHYGREHKP